MLQLNHIEKKYFLFLLFSLTFSMHQPLQSRWQLQKTCRKILKSPTFYAISIPLIVTGIYFSYKISEKNKVIKNLELVQRPLISFKYSKNTCQLIMPNTTAYQFILDTATTARCILAVFNNTYFSFILRPLINTIEIRDLNKENLQNFLSKISEILSKKYTIHNIRNAWTIESKV